MDIFIFNAALVLLFALFVWRGFQRGAVATLAQVLSVIAGFLAARAWSVWLTKYLLLLMPGQLAWATLISYALVFIVVSGIVATILDLLAKVLRIVTSLPLISTINKLLGLIFGLLDGVIVLGAAIYLAIELRFHLLLLSWIQASGVAQLIENAFRLLFGYLV